MQIGSCSSLVNSIVNLDTKLEVGDHQQIKSESLTNKLPILSTPPKRKGEKRKQSNQETAQSFPLLQDFCPSNVNAPKPKRFKKQKQEDIKQIESLVKLSNQNWEEDNQKKSFELFASIKLRASLLNENKLNFLSHFNDDLIKNKVSNNDSQSLITSNLIDVLNKSESKIFSKSLYPLLHKALMYQQIGVFESLLKKNTSLFESRKPSIKKLNNELWKEISKNAISFTKIMLNYVSDLSYLEESTQAALYFQAEELVFLSEKDSIDIILSLSNKQVKINSQYPIDPTSTFSGMTPFLYAVKIGNLKLVEKIWEFKPSLQTCDHWRNNALHLAFQYGHLEIAHFLSQQGFKFTGTQFFKTLKFNEIVKLGRIDIIDFLLRLDVKPNFTASFFESLLFNDESISKYLLEKSSKTQRIKLLHHLAENKSIDFLNNHVFEFILTRLLNFDNELCPFNTPNAHGISFFFKLASLWNLHLKREDLDSNTKNSMFEALNWLLEKGIHPLKTDSNENGTILHLLINWKNLNLLNQILKHSEFLDVSIRDSNNKTALELAQENMLANSIVTKLQSLQCRSS